jgi:retron-type reverse transcriptase
MDTETLETILDSSLVREVKNNGKNGYYLTYRIRKSNGSKRRIDAPQLALKDLQYQILERVLPHVTPHKAAVGFRPGQSIADGADQHVGCGALLNMDLRDFFNNIKFDQVIKTLTFITSRMVDMNITPPWGNNDLILLADLVTFRGCLPQGAPTSPALSNIVARHMDRELTDLASEGGYTYTRYADDLSFSHPTGDVDMLELAKKAMEIIKRNCFIVNHKKTRMQRPHQRMTVTGIVVNEKKSVPKWKWRQFRAKLHNLEKSQKEIGTEEYQQILGYAQWIKQLHPKRGQRFLDQIGNLNYKEL